LEDVLVKAYSFIFGFQGDSAVELGVESEDELAAIGLAFFGWRWDFFFENVLDMVFDDGGQFLVDFFRVVSVDTSKEEFRAATDEEIIFVAPFDEFNIFGGNFLNFFLVHFNSSFF
jgi:hypothetical protein